MGLQTSLSTPQNQHAHHPRNSGMVAGTRQRQIFGEPKPITAIVQGNTNLMREPMKTFLSAVVLLGASMTLVAAAQAQNGPWCAHYDFGSDETVNCSFYSFQQCVADVRGVGGFCSQNNTYGLHPTRRMHPYWYR
jgi:Protein of unknown function (DUF3551)